MTTPVMADLAAERAVLGALMVMPHAADDVLDLLSGARFYDPRHDTIYAAATARLMADEPVDPLSLAHFLATTGDLARVGGAAYLHELQSVAALHPGEAAYHARIVNDWWKRRTGHVALVRGLHLMSDLTQPVDDALNGAQRALSETIVPADAADLQPVGDLAGDVLIEIGRRQRGEVPLGLTTGFADLDRLLSGGWRPGELVIPAGRPGQGKSVASLGFAVTAAMQGRPAIFFALEMQKRELMERLLADQAGVPLNSIKTGWLRPGDEDRLRATQKDLADLPLHISDRANTVVRIRAEARRFRQRHGDLGLIVVDYLQRLTATTRTDRKDLEVGDHAKQLKDLAMELGTTVVGVCQLNRGPEQRPDKRPLLSDLRDSGQLEQEADIVILLYRDDYYDKESPRAGEADFIVAKNRNGATDTITVAAQLHFSRFADMACA